MLIHGDISCVFYPERVLYIGLQKKRPLNYDAGYTRTNRA